MIFSLVNTLLSYSEHQRSEMATVQNNQQPTTNVLKQPLKYPQGIYLFFMLLTHMHTCMHAFLLSEPVNIYLLIYHIVFVFVYDYSSIQALLRNKLKLELTTCFKLLFIFNFEKNFEV